MSYYCYILKSTVADKFYYGQTADLDSRLQKHNAGKVKSTSKYAPWFVFAYISCDTRSEAMSIEKSMKNLKSRIRVAEFIKTNNFTLTAKL
jgi:putative endonuclease